MITLKLQTWRFVKMPPDPEDVYFVQGFPSLRGAANMAREHGCIMFVLGSRPANWEDDNDTEYKLYRVQRSRAGAWYTGWRWLPSFCGFVDLRRMRNARLVGWNEL